MLISNVCRFSFVTIVVSRWQSMRVPAVYACAIIRSGRISAIVQRDEEYSSSRFTTSLRPFLNHPSQMLLLDTSRKSKIRSYRWSRIRESAQILPAKRRSFHVSSIYRGIEPNSWCWTNPRISPVRATPLGNVASRRYNVISVVQVWNLSSGCYAERAWRKQKLRPILSSHILPGVTH